MNSEKAENEMKSSSRMSNKRSGDFRVGRRRIDDGGSQKQAKKTNKQDRLFSHIPKRDSIPKAARPYKDNDQVTSGEDVHKIKRKNLKEMFYEGGADHNKDEKDREKKGKGKKK